MSPSASSGGVLADFVERGEDSSSISDFEQESLEDQVDDDSEHAPQRLWIKRCVENSLIPTDCL